MPVRNQHTGLSCAAGRGNRNGNDSPFLEGEKQVSGNQREQGHDQNRLYLFIAWSGVDGIEAVRIFWAVPYRNSFSGMIWRNPLAAVPAETPMMQLVRIDLIPV